jgi:hypothetical protein
VLGPDGSGRSDASRIYQSSMMEYGNGPRQYDNARDVNLGAGGPSVGLNSYEWDRALTGVLGQRSTPQLFNGNPMAAEAGIRQSLGQNGQAPVAMVWGPDAGGRVGGHALMVEGMDDRFVYLRNPHGPQERGAGEPQRQAGPGGHIRLTKQEFYQHLMAYFVPER